MSAHLLPCPFCGGPAMFEDITSTKFDRTTWSVGCGNGDEDCIGYQMLAHFSRKSEAAEAWNKRAPRAARDPMMAAVASLAAAISLLERTPKVNKAAPSDKMFNQMLDDYRKALANARDALR
jgi:hypothetical protein